MDIDFTAEKVKQILADLAKPFPLADVKWRVTATNKDGSKGLVAPYADPRAYAKRLNDVLSPAGWSIEYKTETLSGLQRVVSGKLIQTGKVFANATLSIFGISSKSSMGEMWADDPNAVTRSEAQALKRAAALFGLGAYFYEVKHGVEGVDLWVPIDMRKLPIKVPFLPSWALLPDDQRYSIEAQNRANREQKQRRPVQMQNPQWLQSTTLEASKQKHISTLGKPLFDSIVSEIDRLAKAGVLKHDKFTVLENTLKAKTDLLNLVSAAAVNMHTAALDALLDRFQIKRLTLIPNYTVLDSIADELGVRMAKAA